MTIAVSDLTGSLTGILKEDYDLDIEKEERLKEKYELQDDLDKIYNVARMVILKNLETGEIYNFIMVFIVLMII